MCSEAAGWNRPILFRGGVGGHASVEQVASDAQKYRIKKLVFAHIGRPTIKAMDAGKLPWGRVHCVRSKWFAQARKEAEA